MNWNDVFTFKTMVSPVLIQIIFWVGVLVCIVGGFVTMFSGFFLTGLGQILIGPLVLRVFCEVFMVTFKINEGIQTLVAEQE